MRPPAQPNGDAPGNAWNRLRYTALAPVYDVAVRRVFEPARRRSLDLLDLQPGERVLVVGCGTGLDFQHLPPGVHLTAGDLTPAMVRRARDHADTLGLADADIRVLDAHRLDLSDASFEAVVLHLLLAVVPDPMAAIREARRTLAPGGRVAVFDKFVPAGERPSLVRRAANVVARVVATDLTRTLEPLLDAGRLTATHDEPAGPGGLFRTVTARAT